MLALCCSHDILYKLVPANKRQQGTWGAFGSQARRAVTLPGLDDRLVGIKKSCFAWQDSP